MEPPSVSNTHCSYPVRAGNQVTPWVDSYHFYERLGHAILQAKHSLWIAVSFFSQEHKFPINNNLVSVWDVLDAAVLRGIDVRVLFWRNKAFTYGTKHVFNGTEQDFKLLWQRKLTFLARWDDSHDNDHCHHEKSWILDAGHESEIAFTGGIVVTGKLSQQGHSPSNITPAQIHDIMLEIQGPACTDVQHSFVQRWNEASLHHTPTGCWPNNILANDLEFPHSLVQRLHPKGDSFVQIQRSIRNHSYSNSCPTPGGTPFDIREGEASIYEQYKMAIAAARDTIYIENQHIAHDHLLDLLLQAAGRGVSVFYLVPGEGIGAAVMVRKQVEQWKLKYYVGGVLAKDAPPAPRYSSIFLEKLPAIAKYPNFCLAGLVNQFRDKYADVLHFNMKLIFAAYFHVYVHSKLMIVDGKWFTIGSANLVDIHAKKRLVFVL